MGFLDRFRKKTKVSPGGSPIYRYKTPEEHGIRPPEAVGVYAREIDDYFASLFPNREGFVIHELVSDLVHIDIHVMQPTADQNYHVLYTTGMSDLPMTLPEDMSGDLQKQLALAELFLFLPPEWDLGEPGRSIADLPPSSFWPVQMMKFLARFPHEYHTWLGWGHSIPNGPDYAPFYEGVGFGGTVLIQPGGVPPLELEDGRQISFYLPVPAYREEIEYKLKYGMEALAKRFLEGKLDPTLDIHRPNFCADFHEILD